MQRNKAAHPTPRKKKNSAHGDRFATGGRLWLTSLFSLHTYPHSARCRHKGFSLRPFRRRRRRVVCRTVNLARPFLLFFACAGKTASSFSRSEGEREKFYSAAKSSRGGRAFERCTWGVAVAAGDVWICEGFGMGDVYRGLEYFRHDW